MKKIILLMLCIVLLVGTVSAWNWDNSKSYDEKTKTVTIKNGCVLGICLGDDISTIKLNTPLVYKVPLGNQKVAEFTINNFKNGNDVFNNLEFFNLRKDNEKFERDYDYKYKTTIKVPKYKTVCDKGFSANRTAIDTNCRQEQTGFKDEIVWEELDINDELPKGKITIGIFTEVLKGDKVEWIPTLFGVEIGEWAAWSASLLVDVTNAYHFNESSGNILDYAGSDDGTPDGISYGETPPSNLLGAVGFIHGSNDVVFNSGITGDTTATVMGWFNTTYAAGDNQYIMINTDDGLDRGWGFGLRSGDNSVLVAGVAWGTGGTNANDGAWHSYMVTRDGSQYDLYLDGGSSPISSLTNAGGIFGSDNVMGGATTSLGYEGHQSETAFFSSVKTNADFVEFHNSGNGLPYKLLVSPTITLNFPIDNYDSIETDITFNGTVYDILGNDIVNVSLYINGVLNETNSSGINNTNYIFAKTLSDGDHNWTYEACDDSGGCQIATTRSLTILRIVINSQTYNNETIEGATETFIANITLRGGEFLIEANLNYNGTSKSATASSLGDETFNLISTFTIPSVIADVNLTFFWMITLTTGQINLSSFNQTVKNIGIDNCTAYSTVIFNYTIVDEENQNQLVGNTDNTSLELNIEIFNLDKSVSVLNFSTSYNQTNPSAVCLSINLTNDTIYVLDSTVKYNADGYVPEYYNIQNFELKNSSIPQEINLFDLLEDDSTEFQITFKDSNFVATENALIQINRQYVSEGLFKTVEIPKTDSNGQTVAHLVEKNIVYNILVLKEGVILGTFSNIIAFCEDAVLGSCFISLNALEAGAEVFDYDEEIGLISSFDYNETTRILQFDFSTTDGSVKNISLSSVKMDRLGNTSVCSSYLVSASGSLYCTVPASIGNETIIVKIYVDGDLKIRNYISAGTEFDIGDAGFFLMFFLVLSLALMMTQSKIGVVIGVVLGFITSSLLALFKGGIIGIGSSLIWLVIMAVILIWKLNSDRQT